MTASEDLFAAFCRQRRIVAVPIATVSELGEQRPDFRIRGRFRRARWIYAEIKEIIPTREESEQIAKLQAGGVASFSTMPGQKIRSLIGSGAPQLRAVAGLHTPAMIVIHELTGILGQHVDPYSVLTAMRGLDVIPVEVPRDRTERPRFGARRIGGKRQMTPTANTTVSAIALLFRLGPHASRLDVFHNPHARCPLRQRDIPGHAIRHFQMTRGLAAWRLVGETATPRQSRSRET